MTRIHGKPSWWEKIFIGIAGTNPNLTPPNTPLGKDEFQLLGIAGGGAPYIATRRRAPKATGVGAKDFEVKISSPTLVRVGGELVTVDRNSPETWNREIRRSGLTPNTRAENMSRAIGALNLVEAAGEGVELTRMADDAGLAAYQLVFETNDDGRRRAFLRVYQVMVENDTGTYVINPTHVSVGPDGKPDFQTIRFHFEPEIRPAGEKPSYRIVQPPPPDGG